MFSSKLEAAVLYVIWVNFSLLTLWAFMACFGVKFTFVIKQSKI